MNVLQVYDAVYREHGYSMKQCEYANQNKKACFVAFRNAKGGWRTLYVSGPSGEPSANLPSVIKESITSGGDLTTKEKDEMFKYYRSRFS